MPAFKHLLHLHEQSLEELTQLPPDGPGWSKEEAIANQDRSLRVHTQRLADGLCGYCGDTTHKEEDCRLKIEGEAELAREAKDRANGYKGPRHG